MANYASILEEQYEEQKGTIKSYKLSILLLGLVGIGLILFAITKLNAQSQAQGLITIGGGIFMLVCARLPYAELAPMRKKKALYKGALVLCKDYDNLPPEDKQFVRDVARS